MNAFINKTDRKLLIKKTDNCVWTHPLADEAWDARWTDKTDRHIFITNNHIYITITTKFKFTMTYHVVLLTRKQQKQRVSKTNWMINQISQDVYHNDRTIIYYDLYWILFINTLHLPSSLRSNNGNVNEPRTNLI